MKKIIYSILLFASSLQAQDALTLLKFEEAEKAFNSGDYHSVLSNIEAVESEIGPTSKTLYLKIMAQKELLELDEIDITDPSTTIDFVLLQELEKNTGDYIEAMKSQGLDERFREVHKLQERLQTLPRSETELKDAFTKPFTEVFEQYYASIGKPEDIANVRTVHVIEESNSISKENIEKYVQTNITKKALGKYALKVEGPYPSHSVYNQEKGIAKGILFSSKESIAMYQELVDDNLSLVSGLLFDMNDIQTLQIASGSLQGEEAMVILQVEKGHSVKWYFSKTSGRLLGTVTSMGSGTVSIIRYTDYREVKGLSFPFKRTLKTYQLSDFGKEGYDFKLGLSDDKVNLLLNQDIILSGNVAKTTLLEINEHIPESEFE